MRINAAPVALLLLAALSGCLGGGDGDGGDDAGDLAGGGTTTGTGTAAPVLRLALTVGNQTFDFTSPSGNAASTATGSASGTGTSTGTASGSATAPGNATGNSTAGNGTAPGSAATPSGAAPLDVAFSVSATGVAAGSAVEWVLDFGDAGHGTPAQGNATVGNATAGAAAGGNGTATGTSLPGAANHTYASPGDYNVTYTLRSGNGTVGTLRALLRVLPGNATNGTGGVQVVPFTAEGTIPAGTQGPTSCGVTGVVDLAEHAWDLAAVAGIQSITVHMDLGATNLDSDIYLLDPAGAEIGSSAAFNAVGEPVEDFTVEGPLEPGVYTLQVKGCMGVEMEYSITASATVVA